MLHNLTTCWCRAISISNNSYLTRAHTVMCIYAWEFIASNWGSTEKYTVEIT
jgi:hypothetical protein